MLIVFIMLSTILILFFFITPFFGKVLIKLLRPNCEQYQRIKDICILIMEWSLKLLIYNILIAIVYIFSIGLSKLI